MKLDELLNQPADYTVTEKTAKYFQAEFTSNDRIIRFDADQQYEYNEEDDVLTGVWEIAFIQPDSNGIGRWDVTRGGKEFEVFATLRKIIMQFFRECQPKEIRFTAEKGNANRADLYQKLFNKMLPAGYTLQRDDDSSKLNSKFMIVKE